MSLFISHENAFIFHELKLIVDSKKFHIFILKFLLEFQKPVYRDPFLLGRTTRITRMSNITLFPRGVSLPSP